MRQVKGEGSVDWMRQEMSAHAADDPREITRRAALKRLSAIAALPLVAGAFDVAVAAPLSYPLKPVRIADGVWVLYGVPEPIDRSNGGAIANTTIFDTREGAVIVDTGPSKRYGVELEACVRELTGKPVARVYLTHFHPDHVFGNQAFEAKAIAAPQGVIDGLTSFGEDFASAMYHAAGDWMRGTELVVPGRAVNDGVEEIGGRRFVLKVLGGHTPCDLALTEETSGIIVAGDLVFLDRAATTPHADPERWRQSLQALAAIKAVQIVPGHGPVEGGLRGLDQTRDWLAMVEDTIRSAFERGMSMNEAMEVPLPAWTEKIALSRYEFERSVMHFFPKLEAGQWPRVDKKT
ncbi:MAG TPA: quinoprotein relay system zinc metallohydrolase 1 [Hyphomicrobiaceae bacterium]|nr:quinoprotein relay system zinc metallohydrolase 1 [Hyphomicrobiaceae bacterium]